MKILTELLSHNLPKGRYKLFHIQTQPYQCKHLLIYNKKNANKPELTIKIKHFITLINDDNLIFMGIEVYIYLTIFKDHISHNVFISKADTTGLCPQKYRIGNLIRIILKYLVEYDINSYCHDVKLKLADKVVSTESSNPTINSLNKIIKKLQHDSTYYRSIPFYNEAPVPTKPTDLTSIVFPDKVKTCISLFTRASEQYLFPNSSKNNGKHIIDGNSLLNWWIKIIDDMLKLCDANDLWNCCLNIPGSDNISISKKLPQGRQYVDWSIGSIFDENQNNLAINQVPLFPDDPKGRFLEHLIVENRYKSMSLKQFWQELGIRQEFRLGNVVGIIGCENQNMKRNRASVSEQGCVLSLGQYKKVHHSIKNQDFSKPDDIIQLVSIKLPEVMKEFCATDYYTEFDGKSGAIIVDLLDGSNKQSTAQANQSNDLSSSIKRTKVNCLSGLIKRKQVNDLSSSIRRKQTNDMTSSIKKKEANDLSGSIKRKQPNMIHPKSANASNNVSGFVNQTSFALGESRSAETKTNNINSLIRKKPKSNL